MDLKCRLNKAVMLPSIFRKRERHTNLRGWGCTYPISNNGMETMEIIRRCDWIIYLEMIGHVHVFLQRNVLNLPLYSADVRSIRVPAIS